MKTSRLFFAIMALVGLSSFLPRPSGARAPANIGGLNYAATNQGLLPQMAGLPNAVYSPSDTDGIYEAAIYNELILKEKHEIVTAAIQQRTQSRELLLRTNAAQAVAPYSTLNQELTMLSRVQAQINYHRDNQLARATQQLVFAAAAQPLSQEQRQRLQIQFTYLTKVRQYLSVQKTNLFTYPNFNTGQPLFATQNNPLSLEPLLPPLPTNLIRTQPQVVAGTTGPVVPETKLAPANAPQASTLNPTPVVAPVPAEAPPKPQPVAAPVAPPAELIETGTTVI